MFVLTLNKKRHGKILLGTVCALFLIGVGTGVKNHIFKHQETAAQPVVGTMSTTQEMADYVKTKGYTIDLQSAQVKEVKIPKKFDAEFENFNEKIKLTDNLSLDKYKNKSVNKWTFNIVDYGIEGKTASCVLLVRKDKLVGTYILQQPDGIALPLAKTDSSQSVEQTK